MIPESEIDPADVLEMALGVRPVITHTEVISCPECWLIQEAKVEHTVPFWTYAHDCRCGFTITESDWEEVAPDPSPYPGLLGVVIAMTPE